MTDVTLTARFLALSRLEILVGQMSAQETTVFENCPAIGDDLRIFAASTRQSPSFWIRLRPRCLTLTPSSMGTKLLRKRNVYYMTTSSAAIVPDAIRATTSARTARTRMTIDDPDEDTVYQTMSDIIDDATGAIPSDVAAGASSPEPGHYIRPRRQRFRSSPTYSV